MSVLNGPPVPNTAFGETRSFGSSGFIGGVIHPANRSACAGNCFTSSSIITRCMARNAGLFAFLNRTARPSLLLRPGNRVRRQPIPNPLDVPAQVMWSPTLRFRPGNDFIRHRNVCHGRLPQLENCQYTRVSSGASRKETGCEPAMNRRLYVTPIALSSCPCRRSTIEAPR